MIVKYDTDLSEVQRIKEKTLYLARRNELATITKVGKPCISPIYNVYTNDLGEPWSKLWWSGSGLIGGGLI